MSTGINMTSKTTRESTGCTQQSYRSSDDVRLYNSTREYVYKNFGYIKSGSRGNG